MPGTADIQGDSRPHSHEKLLQNLRVPLVQQILDHLELPAAAP